VAPPAGLTARRCQPGAARAVWILVRPAAIVAACALALLAPAAASAQETNAPPGNSGIDEYLETVPSASGNRPTGRILSGRPGTRPTPERAARALRGRGRDAQAPERLVRETAPRQASRGRARGGRTGATEPPGAGGDSPLRSVARAVTGDGGGGGMGAALLAILLGALAAATGLAAIRVVRRRSAS
jgi:hypothetical protein